MTLASIQPSFNKYKIHLNPPQALLLLMERSDMILVINPWGSGTLRLNSAVRDIYLSYARHLPDKRPCPLYILHDHGTWNVYLVGLVPDARGNAYCYIDNISTGELIDCIMMCLKDEYAISICDGLLRPIYSVHINCKT